VAWHCRRVSLISDDLLHHEEHIFREECDQYGSGWSTSVLSVEEIPSGIHVDSTLLSALFSDCWSCVFELLVALPGLGARFVRVNLGNKTRLRPGLQDISSPGAGLNATDPRDVLMSRLGSVSVPLITCEGLICNVSVCMSSYSPNGIELSTSESASSW
jgi:hypothetical protein